MKINNKLVKHYIQYDISFLSPEERESLAKEINNTKVIEPLCNGIIKANESKDAKWLASFTRNLNQVSILSILDKSGD